MMDIAKQIREAREYKRFTQAEIARRLDIDPAAYFRLEKRGKKLTIEQLESIANAIEVSLESLLGIQTTKELDKWIQKEQERTIEELTKENRELRNFNTLLLSKINENPELFNLTKHIIVGSKE